MKKKVKNRIAEPFTKYGFVHQSENEKLLQDVRRPYIEKLQLFTKMLKRNKTLNKAVTTVK